MGFSAKQLQALRRNLDNDMSGRARPMAASSPISKAGTRSRKPIGFLALMVGAGRPSKSRCVLARENRGTFLAVYIAGSASLCTPTARPLFAKVTEQVKGEERPRRSPRSCA